MLTVAARLEVYRNLVTADLTHPLTLDHRYGASISAGTFTTGHVDADSIPVIVDVLRPDAVVAWVVAESLWPLFESSMEQHGFHMLHVALEPVRRDGPPESMMVVARLQS